VKLAMYRSPSGPRAAVIDGEHLIDAGESIFDPRPHGDGVPLADVRLLAPVPRPEKIICIGLNYKDHAAESGAEAPTSPVVFSKFANTVIGPDEAIRIPSITQQVDYEAELGVVIGRTTSRLSADSALDHVFGYTCINDVSARDLQFADGQWVRGKTLDTFCPMGPWVVTSDDIPDPQVLPIRCVVNGTTLQDSSTSEMIFSVAEIVAFLSQAITLEAGDVISTGTPAGVGFARKPPIFLNPGDVTRVEIDGIGSLENPVESA
jgi:2,4-didehydro-3-deoxy-L-rhamnonate hydrolase